MWKAVTAVLLGLVASGCGSLTYGPCHDVNKVNLNTTEWPGIYYVNVMTYNKDVSCLWVDRSLKYADGNCTNQSKKNILIAEVFRRIESGEQKESPVVGKYVGKGHYQFSTELFPGRNIDFEAYWMHFNLPDLDCHFVCSHDEILKKGRGAFWCESSSRDALEKNACNIKKIATDNKFNVNDLMVVDNCNCPNMPSTVPMSQCEKVSITEYFENC